MAKHRLHREEGAMFSQLKPYRKAWVAGTAMALIAGLEVAQKVIPMSDAWRGWITVVLAVAGTFLTWRVPNAKAVNNE